MRELQTTLYDNRGYTDENVLYKHRLIDPVQLSKNITFLYGKDSDMFPLLTNTEGQGFTKSIKPKLLNDTQYEWSVMGRMIHTSVVFGLQNPANVKPGLGFTPVGVIFEDERFIPQYGAYSPDGLHQVRIQSKEKLANGKWLYEMILQGSNPNEFIDLGNFVSGKSWVMTVPTVAASKSDGNASNSMAPGKMTNQFGFNRFSKNIAGNVANKVTVFEFDTESGGKTNLWMPFEMKLFEIDRRILLEHDLWFSTYNRDANGQITLFDKETGEPIPRGAGIKEILTYGGNYDTYAAPTLTISKLNSVVDRIFANRIDKQPMELVLYTGAGGRRAFNQALQDDANSRQLFYALSEKIIGGGKTGYMTYGNYFDQFRTIDGYILTIRECQMFNQGLMAELDRKNGNMINNFPAFSYNMVFIDHSMTDDGERNVQLVGEAGREIITGVYKGMSPLPAAWGAIGESKLISTRKDVASYEVMVSQGIVMKNWTTSFWLAPSL